MLDHVIYVYMYMYMYVCIKTMFQDVETIYIYMHIYTRMEIHQNMLSKHDIETACQNHNMLKQDIQTMC